MTELFANFFLLYGAFLILSTTLGMMRLPDIYCRSHALAKSMPLGVNSMLIGLWVHMDLYHSSGFKVFLAILFQVISIPVAGHVMALLAYRKGVPRHNEREIDIY